MTSNDDLDDQLESILEKSVPFISASELHDKLDSENVFLLDMRSEKEHAVSTIPGSEFHEYGNFKATNLKGIGQGDTLVIFCSVGYRSEKAGELLQAAGYRNILNLYGGIFKWKNEGYSVVNPQGRLTDSVHTYNEDWSKYLKNGVKVYD